ncbi:uncharacterized protein F4812DRAFT_388140 [Daldinia caldariorum]|uniref:uncharacterized protein n=1 Tax=Daldinia caldariorum TaxID=326644 RepID=UPI002007237C|nr:uncharacterized protein F4812DRAFT_388140 [Daldinia caldariorum]KAI1468040.1 hypothetical protein F4812DRAFT_388140 [Daldinia caldariorum]
MSHRWGVCTYVTLHRWLACVMFLTSPPTTAEPAACLYVGGRPLKIWVDNQTALPAGKAILSMQNPMQSKRVCHRY